MTKEKKEDYFARAKQMIAASVGRLPTALVIILLSSMAMAAVTGIVMEIYHKPPVSHEFMPLRLNASGEETSPLDLKKFQGYWVHQTSDYAMTLTLVDKRFEWIIRFKDVPEAQFYARGNFRIVGDVMVLGVRTDLGKPFDPQKTWIKYMPMAMKDINTRFTLQGQNMIWTIPSSEQKKIKAQSAQIFKENNDGVFTWAKQ